MAQGSLVTNYIFVPTISLISIYQTFCFTQLDMWEMNLLPHIKCHKVAHELSFCVWRTKGKFCRKCSKMFSVERYAYIYISIHVWMIVDECFRFVEKTYVCWQCIWIKSYMNWQVHLGRKMIKSFLRYILLWRNCTSIYMHFEYGLSIGFCAMRTFWFYELVQPCYGNWWSC